MANIEYIQRIQVALWSVNKEVGAQYVPDWSILFYTSQEKKENTK